MASLCELNWETLFKLLTWCERQTYHIMCVHICVYVCIYIMEVLHNLWTITRIGAYLYNAGNGVHNLTERSIVSQPQQQALFIFYMYMHPHFHVHESCLAPPTLSINWNSCQGVHANVHSTYIYYLDYHAKVLVCKPIMSHF